MKVSTLFIATMAAGTATAFVVNPVPNSVRTTSICEMAKGFDNSAKPEPRKKSEGQIQREQMSTNYDNIAAQGGQEYSIFVRQFGGEDKSWLPCGSIAVPRNGQVSDAIFANEEALKVAIVRTFPKLKGFETEFEYGYNLKVFPDDPVEVAMKQTRVAGPSVGNWISNLLSPIDASKSAPPS